MTLLTLANAPVRTCAGQRAELWSLGDLWDPGTCNEQIWT
jgi:hypothetical protein